MGTSQVKIEFTNAADFDLTGFYYALPKKVQRIMFWDLSPYEKQNVPAIFRQRKMPLIIATQDGDTFGFAWFMQLMAQSDAYFIHFCFDTSKATQAMRLAAGKLALQELAKNGFAQSLLVYFPAEFRHVFTFALALGFESMGRSVKGAIHLNGKSQNSDLIFMQLPLLEEYGNS